MLKSKKFLPVVILCLSVFALIMFASVAFANEGLFNFNQNSDEGLVLYYDFDYDNDRQPYIEDKSGNENTGEITHDKGGTPNFNITKQSIFGKTVKTMELNSNVEDLNTRIRIPKNTFETMQDTNSGLTLSAWVKINNVNGYQRIFDMGTGTDNYVYMLNEGYNADFRGYASAIQTTQTGVREEGVEKVESLRKGIWTLCTMTIDNNGKLTLYENGQAINSAETKSKVSFLASQICAMQEKYFGCYIGGSNYADPCTSANFAEVKIFNRALSDSEVKDMFYVTDKDVAQADADSVDLGDLSHVERDFYLPSGGINGSTFKWASDNDAITIGELEYIEELDGDYYPAHVTRPVYGMADAKVNLLLTSNFRAASVMKNFEANVSANTQDMEMLSADLEEVLANLGENIFDGYQLPLQGPRGSLLSWTSENSAIEVDADGKTLHVTRPSSGDAILGDLVVNGTYGTAQRSGRANASVSPVDLSKAIESVEEINVDCYVGNVPQLPNFVNATLYDKSIEQKQVVWNLDKLVPAQGAGTQMKIDGTVVNLDEKYAVVANVNVVELVDERTEASASGFSLNEVDLTGDNFLTDNRDRDITYLKILGESKYDETRSCNVMRMLYNFYISSKMYTEDDLANLGIYPLGGWDEPHGLLRGHSTGHYVSALALAYGSTGDEEILNILSNMLSEMALIQEKSGDADPVSFRISKDDPTHPFGYKDQSTEEAKQYYEKVVVQGYKVENWSSDVAKWGKGYIGAYSPDQFALLELGAKYNPTEGLGIWAPYYTMHKLLSGFVESYKYLPDGQSRTNALNLAKGLGLWASSRMNNILTHEAGGQWVLDRMWGTHIAGEYGGMNDVLAQIYEICSNEGFSNDESELLKIGSIAFDDKNLFNKFAINEDGIMKLHANQHIPQFIGSIFEHRMNFENGNNAMLKNYYYNVANNFWQIVRGHYAYSIGGVGTGESFKDPYLQASWIDSDKNCETCCAYNLLKLTAQLNTYNPDDAEYMDYYEQTLYNQILASQNPNVSEHSHNGVTYMLPIGPGAWRSYTDDWNSFTCCHGTGMENHVKYQEAAYFKSKDNSTLYVGLYLPTKLTWSEKHVAISQDTDFPSENSKIIIQDLDGMGSSFTMKLRVPSWATQGFIVSKNGVNQNLNATPGSYVALEVAPGDVIDVNMPWTSHLDFTPDTLDGKNVASLKYGPFVMSGLNTQGSFSDLFMQNNIKKSISYVGTDDDGFPLVSTNGINYGANAAGVFASNAYHTYDFVNFEGIANWFTILGHSLDPIPQPQPVPDPSPEIISAQTGDWLATLIIFALLATAVSCAYIYSRKRLKV